MCGRFIKVTFGKFCNQILGLGRSGNRNQSEGCNGILKSNQWEGKVAILEVHGHFSHIDIFLTQSLSISLGQLNQNFVQVVWEFVHNPNSTEETRIYYKQGSSQHWCQVFLTGLPNGLSRIEQKSKGQDWQNTTKPEGQFYELPCHPSKKEFELKLYDADGILYRPQVTISRVVSGGNAADHILVNTIQLVPGQPRVNIPQISIPQTHTQKNQSANSPNNTSITSTNPPQINMAISSNASFIPSNIQTSNNASEKKASSSIIQITNSSFSSQNQNVQSHYSSESIVGNNSSKAQLTTGTSTIQSSLISLSSQQSIYTSTQVNSSLLAADQISQINYLPTLPSITESPARSPESLVHKSNSSTVDFTKNVQDSDLVEPDNKSTWPQASSCGTLNLKKRFCKTQSVDILLICNLTVEYKYMLVNSNPMENHPSIQIDLVKPITMNDFRYLQITMQSKILSATLDNPSSETIKQLVIQIFAKQSQSMVCFDLSISGRDFKQYKVDIPIIMSSNYTTKGRSIVNRIRSMTSQLLNRNIRIASGVGILNSLQTNTQMLSQLSFLDYVVPLGVYELERMVTIWTINKPVPEWEIYPEHFDYLVFFSIQINASDQLNYHRLKRYARITFVPSLIFNLQELAIISLLLLIVIVCLTRKPRQRINESTLNNLNLLQISLSPILQPNNTKDKVQQLIEEVMQKLKKENNWLQTLQELYLTMLIEGRLCIYINTILLAIHDRQTETAFLVSEFLLCLIILLLYLVYIIHTVVSLHKDMKLNEDLSKALHKYPTEKEFYLHFNESYIRAQYLYFLQGKRIESKMQLYSTFIFMLKKWLIGVILVFLYGNVPLQLALLILIHISIAIYKTVAWSFTSKVLNIVSIAGDSLIIGVLLCKYNDFVNQREVFGSEGGESIINKWTEEGWITFYLEVIYQMVLIANILIAVIYSLMEKKSQKKQHTSLENRLKAIVEAIDSQNQSNKNEQWIVGEQIYREFQEADMFRYQIQ